jgi:HEAT repeat protein
MKRLWLVVLGLGFLGSGLVRGADPVQEYEKQVSQPALDLRDANNPTKVREAAAQLGRLGHLLHHIVAELKSALEDPDDVVRLRAAEALAEIGPSAYEAVPALLKAFKDDPNDEVRVKAAGALVGIWHKAHTNCEPQEKVIRDALVEAVKDKSKSVHWQAVNCLGAFGKAAVPTLVGALREKEAEDKDQLRVCEVAAMALERIGPDAKEALPSLLALMADADARFQCCILTALGSIGDQDERVVPTILAALPKERLRMAGAAALDKIGPKRAREIVPALVNALDVRSFQDRDQADLAQWRVLKALTRMGPAAREAVPKIQEILKDPKTGADPRKAAEEALKALRP